MPLIHIFMRLGSNILLYPVMTFFVASSVLMLLAGTVCTVRSSKGEKVLLGSNFTFSCIFNKQCTKLMFRNGTLIKYKQFPNSSEVSVDVKNLTAPSTFSCKCKENPEPCGIDIKPGCKLVTFYNMSLFQGSQIHKSGSLNFYCDNAFSKLFSALKWAKMQSLYNNCILILNNWISLGGSLFQRCGNPVLYHDTLFNFARNMSFRDAK